MCLAPDARTALNKRVKILASQKRLIYTPTNSSYQVLSAETYSKHGFNIHGVVFDELSKRLSDIANGRVSPLQDNDALKLNVPPYVMREAVFRSGDERVQKLADTYEKIRKRNGLHNREPPGQNQPHRKPRL